MATTRVKTQFVFAPITRVDEETRIVEGYAFVNPSVKGDTYSVSRKAMEDATPEYLRWGAIRSMHQPLAAGTAESIVWDKNGALLCAKIVDDQEWRKVQAGVYKGFSIGVRPELVRGNSVEKLTWVENSLVDRPKDPDAVFTVARAEGFDPGEEFECEVEEPATFDELLSLDKENAIRKAFGAPPLERGTIAEDGVSNADPDEEGYRPVKASDCTITREGALFVLNGPDGALIGKFETEAEARARAAEVQDAMKDGDGGQDDATDQHGTTLVLPTDRAEEPVIAEGEEIRFYHTPAGTVQVYRIDDDALLHTAESLEAAGAWVKAHTRAVTATTPNLPVRENLEGKSPKEKRAKSDYDDATDSYPGKPNGPADDEKPATCQRCGAACTRCSGMRGEEPEVARADAEKEKEHGHDSPPEGYPKDKDKYADPKNFKYPVDTEEHARAAWSYINKAKNAGEYSESELSAIKGRIRAACKKFGIETSDDDASRADEPTLTDSTLTIARLETDNAALILRAETAETELARVQTAQEVLTRDLASAKEQITRLEAMPAPQQPLRFAHAVTREFFANARLDHDGETARIVARMSEIAAMAPTTDLGEQAKRAQEYQVLKMGLASRA